MSPYRTLRFVQPKRDRGDAAHCDSNVVNDSTRKPGQSCHADFRDSLSISWTYFASISLVLRVAPTNADCEDQLIRRESRLAIACMKGHVRHSTFTSNRNKNQFCLVDKQCRQRIGGRRCVDNIASDGPAILVCNPARPTRRRGPQPELSIN